MKPKRVRLNVARERLPDPESSWARRRLYGRVRDAPTADTVANAVDGSLDGKAADGVSTKKNGRVRTVNILTTGGPGRPQGSTNFVGRSLKQAITTALAMHENGAAGYMYRLSIERPDLFTTLLRRLLPLSLRAELDSSSLASRMLAVIQAQRSVVANGAKVVDVTPVRRSLADDNP